jgi:phenylpropionate dioxygenase-like ring-hydroxylating dioxygenase large terminal subunit
VVASGVTGTAQDSEGEQAMTIAMENYWHPIGTTAEITEQPRQFKLLGENIVAFRDDAGVVAFKDLCNHRGAALSGGKIKDGKLACPYHGWQYDRTGACVSIPSLPAGSSIPKRARAIVYHARETYGLVWVAMREPIQPFPTWPQNAWDNPGYHVFLINQYLWKASAGRVIENAMDFSHFNFVHAGYTELADGPVIKPHEVARTEHGLAFAYDDTRIRREYELHFPFVLHDTKKVVSVGHGRTWSETSDTRAGDATILTFIATPIDHTTTRLYAFMARNHSLDKPDSAFAEGFDTLTEQDRVIVESQRPEQIPVDIREELHLRHPDAASILYRRLLGDVHNAAAFVP